jgi:hypothetical protein
MICSRSYFGDVGEPVPQSLPCSNRLNKCPEKNVLPQNDYRKTMGQANGGQLATALDVIGGTEHKKQHDDSYV